jgi:ABC-2 type transport system permease protein
MTLTRLEVLRMVRTHRWMALFGIYLFFGVLGPLTARYLTEIIEHFGTGEIVFQAPDPEPIDGVLQFIGNASQLGLLAVVLVAAAAISVDARPEVAAFLRTRVDRPGRLLVPRVAVASATATGALVAGTVVAWGLTGALLGPLPADAMVLGTVLGALYLAFAVAVVAAIAGVLRSVPGIALASLGVLIVLPVFGLVPAVEVWLPSQLFASIAGLIEGDGAGEYLRSTLVTLVVTPLLVWIAMARYDAREL